jgi:nitrate reductase gamma subunit
MEETIIVVGVHTFLYKKIAVSEVSYHSEDCDELLLLLLLLKCTLTTLFYNQYIYIYIWEHASGEQLP